MSYKPNINDPRVRKRIKIAIGFVNSHLSASKSHQWSTRYIDKYLGNQSDNLSKWLRTKLLICTNDKYRFNIGQGNSVCKEYKKNVNGINELIESLTVNYSYPIVRQVNDNSTIVRQVTNEFVSTEYSTELISKDFKYKDQSNRLWHPLQRIRKEYKQKLFYEHNLTHQYDIECCAPTLIYQHSQQIPEIIVDNKYIQGPMDLHLSALTEYLNNRKQVRNLLATETEITYEQAKVIINALLMGAQLGNNKDSDIYQILNGDKARIEFLKQHPYIKELREDIKTCWNYIKPTLPRKQITTKTGKQRMLPISSKQKAIVYFDLERKVLNAINDYLHTTNNKCFLEHDGFVCEKEINKEKLYVWVYNKTGFNINLEYNPLLKT